MPDVSIDIEMLMDEFVDQKHGQSCEHCVLTRSYESHDDVYAEDRDKEIPMRSPFGDMIMIVDASQQEESYGGTDSNKHIATDCSP